MIRYNAATKKNEVLVKDLLFANGVMLSEDESFVIVMETGASRITKYNLKGPKVGKREFFIEGLPGLPDNIHSDGQGGYLVTLFSYVDSQHPQLFQIIMPHPNIRKMAARVIAGIEYPFKFLQSSYPNYYFERIIHWLGHFESVSIFLPDIVTVLRINNKGEIIDAAYATDGKITCMSSAYIHNDYLWLGSPFVEYLARVPLRQAFPSLITKTKRAANIESPPPVQKKVERPPPPPTTTQKPPTTTQKPPTTTQKPATKPKETPTTTTTPRPTTTTAKPPTKAPTPVKPKQPAPETKKPEKKAPAQKVESNPVKEKSK